MAKGGNPNIVKIGAKTRFNSETARAAAQKSNEKQREKKNIFASIRPYANTAVPAEELNESIAHFWELRGIDRECITPMMVDITPIFAAAIKGGDIATMMQIYRLLGLTFDSNREHNVNLSVGNQDNKPFEINFIVEKETGKTNAE